MDPITHLSSLPLSGPGVCSMQWSPDGDLIAFAQDDSRINILNIETGQKWHGLVSYCHDLSWNHSGSLLYSVSLGNRIGVVSADELRLISEIQVVSTGLRNITN